MQLKNFGLKVTISSIQPGGHIALCSEFGNALHILLGDVTWQRVVKSNPPNNSNCYCLNNDELIMQLWESDTFASVNLCPSSVGFRHSAKLPQRFRNSNRNENERIKWAEIGRAHV